MPLSKLRNDPDSKIFERDVGCGMSDLSWLQINFSDLCCIILECVLAACSVSFLGASGVWSLRLSYLPSPCQHSDTSGNGSTGSGCVSSCPQDSSCWPDTHTWRFSERCAGERRNEHTDNQPPNTINHLILDLFNSISVFFFPIKE